MKQKLLKKQDLILIAIILGAAILLFLGTKLMHNTPAKIVEISVDGKIVETLDLANDQELTINGASGGTLRTVRSGSQKPPALIRSVCIRERSISTVRSSCACRIR